MADPLAIGALAVSIAVGLCMTLVTVITCCLLFRARKDLRVLRRKVDYAIVTGKKDEENPAHQQLTEIKVESETHFNSRKGGGGGGGDTPLITPTTPSVPNLAPPPASKAIQIDMVATETASYSAVNVLSMLPDEVRTEENLEGGSLPPEQAQQMLQDYSKKRQEYEDRELQKMSTSVGKVGNGSPTATGGSQTHNGHHSPRSPSANSVPQQQQKSNPVKALKFDPGYEDVEPSSPGYDMIVPVSKYEDPADAVAHEISMRQLSRGPPVVKGAAVIAPKSQISPDKPKKFQMTASLNERYTDVYNPGDGETIGLPNKRAMSESATAKARIVNGEHSPGGLPHHYQNTMGGGGTNSSGESLDNMTHQPFDRKEPIRLSKHKSAKEEVEFDPTARKVFRVTSKKMKRNTNGRDLPDGGGVDSNSDSSPDSKKEKAFTLSAEQSSGEEYSVVNVADKVRYRTEADTMKMEGSGVPQRYSAKSPLKEQAA